MKIALWAMLVLCGWRLGGQLGASDSSFSMHERGVWTGNFHYFGPSE